MNKRTKIGVIGVGHLGQHHTKHYSNIEGANLIGVFDINQARCKAVAAKYNIKPYETQEDLLCNVEAASVVTPTKDHKNVAEECINKKKHVFIEKPITKTVAEAEDLIARAKKGGTIIQVGHIERLNPALLPLEKFDINPKYIEVQRLAPYMSRGTDVPVVLDLMIHDIDLVLALVRSPVSKIGASGISIMTDSVDMANARIQFQNGTVANITSSRIAKDRVRKMKVFQQDLYITIDFLLGLTEIYRVLNPEEPDTDAIQDVPFDYGNKKKKIVYEKPDLPSLDPLKEELDNFTNSVKGNSTPIVDGQAGKNALELAINIHDLILEDLH